MLVRGGVLGCKAGWRTVQIASYACLSKSQWTRQRPYASAAATQSIAEEAAFSPDSLSQQTIIENLDGEEATRLSLLRNVGISAHIDSGKTTFTERVLYYTGRIKEIHEVRGKDNVGAKMDSMDLEREKGITIQSAATYCSWKKVNDGSTYQINIIDTPGHIDFTIEVERALRVLDGAVLVLCAVSGVQSQTITVDRQMRRYNVPRIAFINKLDRMGANPWKAIEQINAKLKCTAAAIQVPIGLEDELRGVIDIIHMKAIYNEGPSGVHIRIEDSIPSHLQGQVNEKRKILIETLADVDDEIAELYLMEETPTSDQLMQAIRRATVACRFTPVMMGSALANKGVQTCLDAVCDFLPTPSDVQNTALDLKRDEAPVVLLPYSSQGFVGLAFKLEEGKYGQLTYIRVYQGLLKRGGFVVNVRTGKRIKVPRLVRMHSNEMQDVDSVGSGEICALFGVDCASGDTFTDGSLSYTMTSMFVPDPVVSLALKPKNKDSPNFSKALSRFQREDPTFRSHLDQESKETIISGMGELHLDIYVERMRREYATDCTTGKPQVAYRETICQPASFSYTHKKQSGGAGQYAKVMGYIEPIKSLETGEPVPDVAFENKVTGAHIPIEYIPACEKGFREGLNRGYLIGHPINGCRMVLEDGAAHAVDSSELAFRLAAIGAVKEAFSKAKPIILEPIMTVSVSAPIEFQGAIIGNLNKRMATILNSEVDADDFRAEAEVSLSQMFGYSSDLRAQTQGKGEFSMEFCKYLPVPGDIQRQLVADFIKTKQEQQK